MYTAKTNLSNKHVCRTRVFTLYFHKTVNSNVNILLFYQNLQGKCFNLFKPIKCAFEFSKIHANH